MVVKLNGTEVAQRPVRRPHRRGSRRSTSPALVAASGNVLEIAHSRRHRLLVRLRRLRGLRGSATRRATVAHRRALPGHDAATARLRGRRASRPASRSPSGRSRAARGRGERAGRGRRRGRRLPGGPGDVYAAAQSALLPSRGSSAGVPAAQLSASRGRVPHRDPPGVRRQPVGDLVALEESRGFSTEVVTVDRIFAAYSDHASSAEALKSFLAASLAEGQSALRAAGRRRHDRSLRSPRRRARSPTCRPTTCRLRASTCATRRPTRAWSIATNDGLGDVPIGRLPVRTPAELEAVVEKLVAWEQRIGHGPAVGAARRRAPPTAQRRALRPQRVLRRRARRLADQTSRRWTTRTPAPCASGCSRR